jgi:hypothetical protein
VGRRTFRFRGTRFAVANLRCEIKPTVPGPPMKRWPKKFACTDYFWPGHSFDTRPNLWRFGLRCTPHAGRLGSNGLQD